MSGNWKQIILEKAIEAAVITVFNFVLGLVANGITLARNGIEWVFGGRNEAESDWLRKIGEVAEKARNELAEYERKSVEELISWASMYNSNSNSNDDPMIMPSRGLWTMYFNPQRFYTCKYGDHGRFTLIYTTTSPQFEWTYPRAGGSDLPSAVVSSKDVEGGGRWFTFNVGRGKYGMFVAAQHGRVRRKIIYIISILPRSYLLMVEVDAWADSSSTRLTFAFSVLPLPFDFVEHKFLKRARKFCKSKGLYFSLAPRGNTLDSYSRPTLASYALPTSVLI